MSMGVSVLGPVQVDGETRLGPRERTVLSALVLRAGQALSPDEIADACWGGRRPATWPKQIQAAVVRLRRVLPRGSIVTLGAGYRLDVPPDDLDVARFSALVDRSRRLARDGEPERAVVGFAEALDLWRGQPFADLEGWEPAAGAALRLAELRRSAEDDLLAARLASGDDEGVAVDAEGGVHEEPLRERRWALLALAQYRGGRQGDALATIRRARAVLVEQLGVDPGQELVSLETAILRQDPSLAGVRAPPPASGSCPYPGLGPFDTSDHENFFGRDREIADGLARLEASPVLVLSGPSGCGKSSLLRAGLVAELRRRGHRVELVLGGVDALRSVREASLAAGPEGVVALDQAEELLTRDDVGPCGAELSRHVEGGGRVLLAVRADALADLAMAAELTAAVENGLYLVRPLGAEAVRAAIVEPARRSGLRLESGLVDLVLHDVEDQPAALPLLSHALVETWQRRQGATLTVEGYEQSGGLSGAVSRSAERLFESLPVPDRTLCRSLMLRLVLRPVDGSVLARHVPVTALPADQDTARVLGRLVESRLITSGDDGVGLAHESLARSWPRLQTWLDEDTEGLRVMRHLATAAEAWEALGRPGSELYRGARLDAALEWREASEPDLTVLEAEFVAASVEGLTAEQERETARARRDRTQNHRLRWLLGAAVLLLVVTVGAGAVARSNASRAERERDASAAARDEQRVEALTNASLALRGTNRAEAALLAAAAYQRWPDDPRTHSALLGTFTGGQGFVSDIPVAKSMNGALLSGGDRAFVAIEGRVPQVVDLQSLAVVRSLPHLDVEHGPGDVIAASADGRVGAHLTLGDGSDEAVKTCHAYAEKHGGLRAIRAASTVAHNPCVTLSTFDLTTGRRLMAPVMLPTQMGGLALSPDGRTVAVVEGHQTGDVVLFDVHGKVLAHLPGPPLTRAEPDWFVGAIAFGPDGTLYAGSSSGVVRRFDGRSGRLLRTYHGSPWSSDVALDVGPDRLLVTIGEQHIEAIDVRTGALRWSASIEGNRRSPCAWPVVSQVADRIYCGSYHGSIVERVRSTGQMTGRVLQTQRGNVGTLQVSTDGRDLVDFGATVHASIERWRIDGAGAVAALHAPGKILMGGYGPGGDALLVAPRPAGEDWSRATFRPSSVWQTAPGHGSDRALRPLPAGADGLLARAGTLVAGPGDQYRLLDPRTGAMRALTAIRPGAGLLGTAVGGRLVLVGDEHRLEAVDPAADEVIGKSLPVRGYVSAATATPDLSRVVVTSYPTDFDKDAVTDVFDGRTGRRTAKPLTGWRISATAGDVVALAAGSRVVVYDARTMRPRTELAGITAEPAGLQLSSDGNRLLATSRAGTVSLYDTRTGLRLGDPIEVSASAFGPNGDLVSATLRPDGRALAVTGANGVLVWNLDPAALSRAACRLAGRELTAVEWRTYASALGRRRAVCA